MNAGNLYEISKKAREISDGALHRRVAGFAAARFSAPSKPRHPHELVQPRSPAQIDMECGGEPPLLRREARFACSERKSEKMPSDASPPRCACPNKEKEGRAHELRNELCVAALSAAAGPHSPCGRTLNARECPPLGVAFSWLVRSKTGEDDRGRKSNAGAEKRAGDSRAVVRGWLGLDLFFQQRWQADERARMVAPETSRRARQPSLRRARTTTQGAIRSRRRLNSSRYTPDPGRARTLRTAKAAIRMSRRRGEIRPSVHLMRAATRTLLLAPRTKHYAARPSGSV